MNADLHRDLVRLGVSSPDKETQFLSEGAVAGVIRWTKDENKRGRQPSSSVIVNKLRGGGLEGYGQLSDGPKAWYRTSWGRLAWMERELPVDTDPVYAEAAIISLAAQKREPTSDSVKALAFQLEQEQAEHHERCCP